MIDALKAVIMLDSAADAPCWIDGTNAPPAGEAVSMGNGLLHVPTRTLCSPTRRGSSTITRCRSPYRARVRPAGPVAQAFLDELWSDDQPSIDTLQETMGYILGGDTSQQKMFLLVGPKRAGKGTIATGARRPCGCPQRGGADPGEPLDELRALSPDRQTASADLRRTALRKVR